MSESSRGAEVFRSLAPEGAAPPWEGVVDMSPVLAAHVEQVLGDVIGTPELDLRTREILTVGILATMGGCDTQLAFHVGGALRTGATVAEIVATVAQVAVYAGVPRSLNALAVVREALAEEGISFVVP